MISELSDLAEPPTMGMNSDFDEGLRVVWGSVHPDITSTAGNEGENSRTHLYPFKGGSPRRMSPKKKKRQMSADVKNWRQ